MPWVGEILIDEKSAIERCESAPAPEMRVWRVGQQPDAWTQADVDAAADHPEDAGILTRYAAMCLALGCRYADFLRPLREAAERASAKYGRPVQADDQLFVMHRVPPRDFNGTAYSWHGLGATCRKASDGAGSEQKQGNGADRAEARNSAANSQTSRDLRLVSASPGV
jgi:hypothetical protein